MQNQILGFFIISTVAFAGLSVVQWKRSAHYQHEVVAIRQEAFEDAHNAGMREAEVRSLERRLKSRDEDTAALTEMVQSLMESTNELTHSLAATRMELRNAAAMASTSAESAVREPMRKLGKMLEDPAMQAMVRSQQRMMMDTMYGPLFLDLQLDEAQTKALQEMLLDSRMAAMKSSAAAMSGDEAQRAVATEELSAEMTRHEDRIKELLGEKKFAMYRNYKQTMGERMMLTQYKNQLDGSGNPLQDNQFSSLLQVALEEKGQAGPGLIESAQDPLPGSEALKSPELLQAHLAEQEEVYRRVLRRAEDFLTPGQVVSLQEHFDNQIRMVRLGLEMGNLVVGEAAAIDHAGHP